MKTLIAVLALCAFVYAGCPKMHDPITKQDYDSAKTVAYVSVTRADGNVYDLQYWKYYKASFFSLNGGPNHFSSVKTLTLNGCPKLEVDADYILGCNKENDDCTFMRRYDHLTTDEKKLFPK
ncbi:hypothetical protein Aduo_010089 [Ancylostoma duodenale]